MTVTLQNIQEKKSELLLVKMEGLGIERNCRDYRQYVIAKRLVGRISEDSQEYEKLIRIVVDYINI